MDLLCGFDDEFVDLKVWMDCDCWVVVGLFLEKICVVLYFGIVIVVVVIVCVVLDFVLM